jgi:cysteine-rich repeat protein
MDAVASAKEQNAAWEHVVFFIGRSPYDDFPQIGTPPADGQSMRCRIPYSIANAALVTLVGCMSPLDQPADGVGESWPEGGIDGAFDHGSPIILNDGFGLPHGDAQSDGSASGQQASLSDRESTSDSAALETSFAGDGAKIADAHTLDICSDVPAPRGIFECDSPVDGRGPDARADGEARADGGADAHAEAAADTSAGTVTDACAGGASDAGVEAAADGCAEAADDTGPGAADAHPAAWCGNGVVEQGELCDDGNLDDFDSCSSRCQPAAEHLIITEIVTRPSGAEMVEIHNPTAVPVDLSDYALSDSHQYFTIASGSFSTASGSDFVAFFPPGSQIAPGSYRTVSIANASGGQVSFESVYGKKPDFELRPKANGASDDADVPNMQPVTGATSIGASASLTDSGEPVILFRYGSGSLVYDVDYVYYGTVSTANPAVDKTGIIVGGVAYRNERAGSLQQPAAAPGDGGALHRCVYGEGGETKTGGNATTCHDETSEVFSATFVRSANAPDQRTPGGPPPSGLCP